MMILRSAPPSPFGRKVKIAAALLGLSPRIEVILADTNDVNEPLRQQNPLGKIPVLITEEGVSIYDSRVIVEYLDHLAGGNKLIPTGAQRFPALTLQALADGLMDASILRMYEIRFREEHIRSAKWTDYQADKVKRGLDVLEMNPPVDDDRTIGGVSVACALGYLDLRFNGEWRKTYPRLVAFLDRFAADVPAYQATHFVPPPA